MSNIKLKSLLCESIPDNEEVAIFKVKWGKKNFLTGISGYYSFTNFDSAIPAFGDTIRFDKIRALQLIQKNKYHGEVYGIVSKNGEQEIIK